MYKYKYAYFTNDKGQTVISARSTFAGKTVKGYAKCDPRDNYSVETGEKLAAARCEARIAQKRKKYAATKVACAQRELEQAYAYLKKMLDCQNGAVAEADAAEQALKDILNEI